MQKDLSSLIKQLTAQTRDLTRKHRSLMSRGRTMSLTEGLEGSKPAVLDLVLGSGLGKVKGLVPCALTGLLRFKSPRIRLSESRPRHSVPSGGRRRCVITRNPGELSAKLAIERNSRRELQRKEKLYKRLEALATPRKASVFGSFSWTAGRFPAANATIR